MSLISLDMPLMWVTKKNELDPFLLRERGQTHRNIKICIFLVSHRLENGCGFGTHLSVFIKLRLLPQHMVVLRGMWWVRLKVGKHVTYERLEFFNLGKYLETKLSSDIVWMRIWPACDAALFYNQSGERKWFLNGWYFGSASLLCLEKNMNRSG